MVGAARGSGADRAGRMGQRWRFRCWGAAGSAQICSCNNVTGGELKCAVPTVVGTFRAEVMHRGRHVVESCVPLLKQLLKPRGVEQSKALCEHFQPVLPRAFLNHHPESDFLRLLDRFGRGRVATSQTRGRLYLASTGSDHILDGEQAPRYKIPEPFLANIRRTAVAVIAEVHDIKPEHLILIGQIAQDFGLYTRSPAVSGSTCSAPRWISCRMILAATG